MLQLVWMLNHLFAILPSAAIEGLEAAQARFLAGDFAAAKRLYNEVRGVSGDSFADAWIDCRLSTLALREGNYGEAMQICISRIAKSTAAYDTALLTAQQALVSAYQSQLDDAQRLAQRSATLLDAAPKDENKAHIVRLVFERALGNVQLQQGEADNAQKTFERGSKAAQAAGDELEASIAEANKGEASILAGRYSDALTFTTRAYELKKKFGDEWGLAHTAMRRCVVNITLAALSPTRIDPLFARNAQRDLDEANERAKSVNDPQLGACLRIAAGRLQLLHKAPQLALRELEHAKASALRVGARATAAEALLVLATTYRALANLGSADHCAREAASLATLIGAQALTIEIALEHAEINLERGQSAKAGEDLTLAARHAGNAAFPELRSRLRTMAARVEKLGSKKNS